MKIFKYLLVAGILLITAGPVVWELSAKPDHNAPQKASPPGAAVPKDEEVSASPGQVGRDDTLPVTRASSTHSINWVSAGPTTITQGSPNPVIITAQITDPMVISNGVNLIYTSASGTQQVIGTLNDAGVNGDVTAGDHIFTIAIPFSSYPTGSVSLSLSAAFSGTLRRTPSGPFSVTVIAPPSGGTSGWVTMTDSQRLFTVQVPSNWNLLTKEYAGDNANTLKTVAFDFPDGTTVFSISVCPIAGWAFIQTESGPIPGFLAQNSTYVFGISEPQSAITNEATSQDTISQDLPQILATFAANQ